MTPFRSYRGSDDPSPFMGVLKKMSFHAGQIGGVARLRQTTPDGEVTLMRVGDLEFVDIVPTLEDERLLVFVFEKKGWWNTYSSTIQDMDQDILYDENAEISPDIYEKHLAVYKKSTNSFRWIDYNSYNTNNVLNVNWRANRRYKNVSTNIHSDVILADMLYWEIPKAQILLPNKLICGCSSSIHFFDKKDMYSWIPGHYTKTEGEAETTPGAWEIEYTISTTQYVWEDLWIGKLPEGWLYYWTWESPTNGTSVSEVRFAYGESSDSIISELTSQLVNIDTYYDPNFFTLTDYTFWSNTVGYGSTVTSAINIISSHAGTESVPYVIFSSEYTEEIPIVFQDAAFISTDGGDGSVSSHSGIIDIELTGDSGLAGTSGQDYSIVYVGEKLDTDGNMEIRLFIYESTDSVFSRGYSYGISKTERVGGKLIEYDKRTYSSLSEILNDISQYSNLYFYKGVDVAEENGAIDLSLNKRYRYGINEETGNPELSIADIDINIGAERLKINLADKLTELDAYAVNFMGMAIRR